MIRYKTPEVGREFNDINRTDARLYGFINALAWFVWNAFRKDITLTDVARYDGRIDSPHFICNANPKSRAADVRCHLNVFTDHEKAVIQNWAKVNFPRSDMIALEAAVPGWVGTIRIHGEGDNEHMHCAVETLGALRKALGVEGF